MLSLCPNNEQKTEEKEKSTTLLRSVRGEVTWETTSLQIGETDKQVEITTSYESKISQGSRNFHGNLE